MPAAPCQSRMPAGSVLPPRALSLCASIRARSELTSPACPDPCALAFRTCRPHRLSAEEKREYQKERNRRKQAALRSRRLAERELATKNDDSPPAPPSLAASAGGGPSTLPEAECEVTRLERVVERLSGMLRALGVEESEISRAVAGEGNPCGAEGRRTDESGGMSSTASSSSQSQSSAVCFTGPTHIRQA